MDTSPWVNKLHDDLMAIFQADDEAGGHDVQIQVELIPTLNAITTIEQTLAAIAAESNGIADGWGVRQKN